MERKHSQIEIGQLRLWIDSVWQDKTFLVVERFTDLDEKMLKILQGNRQLMVHEDVARRMSVLIEEP